MNKKNLFILIGIIGIILLAGIFFIPQKIKDISKNSTPVLLSISPTGLPQNSVGVTLRVYGRNLTNTSVINWNGTAVPTDTQKVENGFISTDIPASYFMVGGSYPVTVTNEKGKTSNAIDFNVFMTIDIQP